MTDYRKIDAINFSKLAALDRHPINLTIETEESKALDLGGAVDILMFDGEKRLLQLAAFTELEEPTATLKTIIDYCHEHDISQPWQVEQIVNEKLDNGKFKYWSTTTKPESRNRKWNTPYFWDYLNFLFDSKDKMKFSPIDKSKIYNAVEVLNSHEFTREIFKSNGKSQLPLVHEIEGYKFKGLLDWVVFDEKNKIIYPYDLKTTSKYLSAFESSVLYYRYDIQSSLYKHLLEKEFPNYQIADFKMIVYSFASESVNIFNLRNYYEKARDGYQRNEKHIKGWLELAGELQWHLKNELYDHPKNVYESNGEIIL